MTTTIGIVCDKEKEPAVVLASEQRATMGNFIASKTAQKIYQIGDTMGMTTAGTVGDAQTLVTIVKAQINLYKMNRSMPMTVGGISSSLSLALNGLKYNPYLVQLVIGGLDKYGAHLYAIDALGGATVETDFTATGSGSPGAYGLLENRYKENMTIEEAKKLAIEAILVAEKRDSASGEDPKLVVITREGYQEVPDEEIKSIIENL